MCICFSGDYSSDEEKIYTLKYYKETAKAAAWVHMLAIMIWLTLEPAAPLIRAVRDVSDLPIHFHTHCTSSASLASALAMANAGCEIDTATSSMADCMYFSLSFPVFLSHTHTHTHLNKLYRHIPTEYERTSSLTGRRTT